MSEEGILLIDKPLNWTSFDVVNHVRGLLARSKGVKPKSIKVGHIGTLDPLASGLMVLLVGKKYTSKAEQLSKLDKIYQVEAQLGYITESFDSEFKAEFYSDIIPDDDVVAKALKDLIKQKYQIPPIYSALKINGKRAYNLAREGKEVELKKRPIKIFYIEKVLYKYPILKFETKVSSGTYIRSMVNDLGIVLKTGAYMSSLRRIAIGPFEISKAIQIDDGLSNIKIQSNLKKMQFLI